LIGGGTAHGWLGIRDADIAQFIAINIANKNPFMLPYAAACTPDTVLRHWPEQDIWKTPTGSCARLKTSAEMGTTFPVFPAKTLAHLKSFLIGKHALQIPYSRIGKFWGHCLFVWGCPRACAGTCYSRTGTCPRVSRSKYRS
jgi:hypothetical protein